MFLPEQPELVSENDHLIKIGYNSKSPGSVSVLSKNVRIVLNFSNETRYNFRLNIRAVIFSPNQKFFFDVQINLKICFDFSATLRAWGWSQLCQTASQSLGQTFYWRYLQFEPSRKLICKFRFILKLFVCVMSRCALWSYQPESSVTLSCFRVNYKPASSPCQVYNYKGDLCCSAFYFQACIFTYTWIIHICIITLLSLEINTAAEWFNDTMEKSRYKETPL